MVIALIIILASVGLAQYKNSVVHAKESVLKDDLFKMRDAIDQYFHADKGKYPESLSTRSSATDMSASSPTIRSRTYPAHAADGSRRA